MRSKKSGKIIAAIVSVFSFLTVAYISCNKQDANLNTCDGVICENMGYCHIDTLTRLAHCFCPTGYEGSNCATVSVDKYLGTWNMRQVIVGSDSLGFVKDTTYYQIFLKSSATPTTFFIDNFADNPYYNNVLCSLDSANSFSFTLDTFSTYHMVYNNYKILYGTGTISPDGDSIIATFATRHLSTTTNWINDTISMKMTMQ